LDARSHGDLLAASGRIERGIGMPQGLLARAIAPTDDGIVLVNLWASEELRRDSNEDRAHEQVVRESGIADLIEGTTRPPARDLALQPRIKLIPGHGAGVELGEQLT
jgi:hypothetical protein